MLRVFRWAQWRHSGARGEGPRRALFKSTGGSEELARGDSRHSGFWYMGPVLMVAGGSCYGAGVARVLFLAAGLLATMSMGCCVRMSTAWKGEGAGLTATTPWSPVVSILAGADPKARARILLAVAEVNALRTDPEFLRQVGRFNYYPSWMDAHTGDYYRGEDVVSFLRWAPSSSTIKVVAGPQTTSTDTPNATVWISDEHLGIIEDCSRSNGLSPRLVNTMMHEFTHLIPEGRKMKPRFRDKNHHGGWRSSAVSYQVGNLAQCYLLSRGRVSGVALDAAIDSCRNPLRQNKLGNIPAGTPSCCG